MSESPTDDFIINVDTWALQEDSPDRCIMCGCCGGKRDMDCWETECGCHDSTAHPRCHKAGGQQEGNET